MADSTTTARVRLALEGANVVERGLSGVQAKISDVGRSMAGLAGGLTVAGFAAWVKGAIEAADQTEELMQKTGLLAEQVAGLKLLFEKEGLGEEFGKTMAKLSKGAAEGNKAFEAMGISVQTSTGKLKDTRVLLAEVADKFAGYRDGAEKTALAQELFGKTGADLIPLLNNGAAGIDEMDQRARELGLTMSKETVVAAAQFNDNLFILKNYASSASVSIANELLPSLVDLSTAFVTATRYGGGLIGTLRLFGSTTYSTDGFQLTKDLEAAREKVRDLSKEIATYDKSSGAYPGMQKTLQFEQQRLEYLKDLQRQTVKTAASDQYLSEARRLGLKTLGDYAPRLKSDTENSKANAAAKKLQATTARDAAKAAKELADTMVRAQALSDKLSEQYVRDADAVMEGNDALREEIALIGASVSERAALIRAKEEEILADKQSLLIRLQNAGDREENITSLQREIALRKERLNLLDRKTAAEAAVAMQEENDKAIQALGQRMDTEWDRTSEYLSDTLSGAIMAGFNGGKGFVRDFAAYLGQQLKQALAQELSASLKGLMQYYLTGNSSGMQNSLIGAAMQYYSGGRAGASSASLAYANMVGAFGGDSIGALYTANGGWSGVSAGAAHSLGGTAASGASSSLGASSTAASSSWMSYAGYAALIAVAIKVAEGLYAKGWNREALGYGKAQTYRFGYSSYTSDPNMGKSVAYDYNMTGLGEKYAYSIMKAIGLSEKWASILSGTVRMAHLFGRKLSGYGYEASINGSDVTVGGYAQYKGGVFRSNKTQSIAIDSRDAEMLRMQIEAVRNGAKGMARAMGYSGDAIDAYTGKLRVNMKGADTAAEQAERMSKAMDDLQYTLLKTASGGKMARAEFDRLMERVKQDIQDAGISVAGLADIMVQGMTGKLSAAEVGDQLASTIVGGIYNSIASNYAGVIAQAFMQQIITPIFTAIAAGVPISQAISQSAINNVVATAQAASQALNEIVSSAQFQAAFAGIEQAIGGVSEAVTSVDFPEFAVAINEVNQAEQERYNLETELLTLLGDTTRLRQRELEALDASNRALKQQIWAIEDAKSAVDAARDSLTRAIEAQRDAVNEQLQKAQDAESMLSDVFGVLRDNIRELRGEVESTNQLGAAQGRANILAMLAGTMAVSSDSVSAAVQAVRDGIDATIYASAVDRDRARLLAANQFAALQSMVQPQLTAAEASVVALQDQLIALDNQAKLAEQQVNALYGIDTSVKTVAQAVADLGAAMNAYTAAKLVDVSSFMSAAPSGSGGGGGGGWEGGGGSSGAWTAAGYAANNPDVVAAYEANKNADWWPSNLNSLDAYLQWHWSGDGQREGRQYAKGGYYPGGLALVGEQGPELINFRNPGQVYTADQTRSLMGGGSDPELKSLVRELIALMKEGNAAGIATAMNTAKTDKRLSNVIRAEDGSERLMVGTPGLAPLPVEIVS